MTTSSFRSVTVDEDFGVDRGSSYSYTRTVHLGPYTVQVRAKRGLVPRDSWAVAEIFNADLTWTALAHSHSERWFEPTKEPYGVNAKDELSEVADDLIRRVTAIIPAAPPFHSRPLT